MNNVGKKLCYLTESESEKILSWIAENGYTLKDGHFELYFSFSAYGNYIEFTYSKGDNKCLLEVSNDYLVSAPPRTVNHITTDTRHVRLELSDEVLETYFQLSREITEAHVDADCEPPGSGLIFEIYHDCCNILTNRRQLIYDDRDN